ncbi:hypothetical protein HDU96_002970 [Phlyctochytrium bullatum]|nr:hypothetical protein HDU96_002970 [Phlyctochytrium bullatum]
MRQRPGYENGTKLRARLMRITSTASTLVTDSAEDRVRKLQKPKRKVHFWDQVQSIDVLDSRSPETILHVPTIVVHGASSETLCKEQLPRRHTIPASKPANPSSHARLHSAYTHNDDQCDLTRSSVLRFLESEDLTLDVSGTTVSAEQRDGGGDGVGGGGGGGGATRRHPALMILEDVDLVRLV